MEKIKELLAEYREVISYLFFGVCTTLVNIVTYFICSTAGVGTAASTILAWVLSVLFAYLTNRYFVFENRAVSPGGILREAVSFFSCRLATGILDLLIMVIFVDLLGKNGMLIKILSNILVIILNYVASKVLIFRTEDTSAHGPKENFFEKVPGYFRILFCMYVIFTLFLMLTIDTSINTKYIPNVLGIPNFILIVPALLLFSLFAALEAHMAKKHGQARRPISERQFYLMVSVIFAAVFLVQLFITSHIYFRGGWDVGVLTVEAERIAFNPSSEFSDFSLYYFGSYPNNLTMLYTLVIFFKIGGILFPANPYLVLIALANLAVCVSVFLSTLCIYKITGSRCVTSIGMGIGVFLIALSPWIQIPYTDAFGMFFPAAAIFCYLHFKNGVQKFSLTSFFCVMGYFYKPTIAILLIALVILAICAGIASLWKKEFSARRLGCFVLALAIGADCSLAIDKAILSQNHLNFDGNLEKTMAHYLMMGLNTETDGGFSGNDVAFSDSFPDVESRNEANIKETASRLKEMGGSGYLKHLIKKTLCNYNDGTFGYGREGDFYLHIPEEQNGLDRILRQFFYHTGQHYHILATAEHILWLVVLIGICFCILPGKKEQQAENLIALTLLGVSMFLLLFECRSRYLYLFTPLYLILATAGMHSAGMMLQDIIGKRQKKS